MNPFKDNFGQEVNTGDFIMYAVNAHMRVGLVYRVADEKSLRVYYCGYKYDYMNGHTVIPILKNQSIDSRHRFITKISGDAVLEYIHNSKKDPSAELDVLANKYIQLTGRNIQNIKWEVLDGVKI